MNIAEKIDLMKKVKGIFAAEGFEIRPKGLAVIVQMNGKSIATIWPNNSEKLNAYIETGPWEGAHGELDVKKALLMTKEASKELGKN